MNKNKLILKYCPNFHKIVNFDFFEDDSFTAKLIEVYEDYIFNIDENNSEMLKKVTEIDHVLSCYIEDYEFRKEMKYGLSQIKVAKGSSNILGVIVDNIIKIFMQYEEGTTRKIYVSRWI